MDFIGNSLIDVLYGCALPASAPVPGIMEVAQENIFATSGSKTAKPGINF
ncbi:Uncharacterised protein [Bordetella pertussis]|nr:Uncharacterised protein [Bordetella pertussis]CFP57237.1 Uncharacterised protein [Bordetella pertussis]CFW39822.1 Uncharacterised protein [Bordetella pertussis]